MSTGAGVVVRWGERDLRGVTLWDEHVVLRPLRVEDAGALVLAAGGTDGGVDGGAGTFDYFPPPYAPRGEVISVEAMARYIESRVVDGACVPFAVVVPRDDGSGAGGKNSDEGRVVGSTCFLDVRASHRGVEIGATFYARESRGTRVNPAAKRLLLRHAFEELGAERVQLKCDARNVVSMRAIERLGAVREGVLRRHMVMADGFVRDTVMYSIVAAEWPRVRAGLDARIGGAGSIMRS